MMTKIERIAIIDTGVLRNFYKLDKLHFLNLFYNTVLIPNSVEEEFLNFKEESNSRFEFILKFYHNHSTWFKKCNLYSQEDFDIFYADREDKTLGRGEVEVFGQYNRTNSIAEILIDDLKAYKHAERMFNPSLKRTLVLLAEMGQGGILDYFESCEKLKQSGTRLKNEIIYSVFRNSYEKRGLPVPSERIPFEFRFSDTIGP